MIRHIVATGDWHLDARTSGVARAEEIERSVWESAHYAASLTVGAAAGEAAFFFLGDLTDPEPDRIASAGPIHAAVGFASEIARYLRDEGVWTYWMTGNHDIVDDGTAAHVLLALAGAPAARVVDRPGMVDGLPSSLALPYTPRCRSYDPAAAVREAGKPGIVFGHLNDELVTDGAGSESNEMARGRSVCWPDRGLLAGSVCVGGHYHRAMTVRGIHYAGAPARLTHGEEDHQPGFIVLQFDEVGFLNVWNVSRIPFKGARRLVTIRSLEEMAPEKKGKLDGALVRLALPEDAPGESAAAEGIARSRGAAAVRVEPERRKTAAPAGARATRREAALAVANEIASADRAALLEHVGRRLSEGGV